ncbi:hypothetical protein Pint_13441 [Pistacia integerrima]|uniref:Uncharacterized protein n=1 Tax=Pistacia integerrima TaxID=434235 RepID=A0ACC0Y3F3_9ROSI|nr:hypothetical protein Pint_13441 [Pistacia integerrima]
MLPALRKSIMNVLPDMAENVIVKRFRAFSITIKDVWVDGSWDENYLVELVGLDKTEEIMNSVVVGKLGIPLASRCNFCTYGHTESLNHVLCNGSIAIKVWKTAAITLGITHVYGLSWWSTVMQWLDVFKKLSHRGVLLSLIPSIITWHLWMRRCKARMENSAESVANVWLVVKVWIRKISSLMVKQWPISARDEVILRALEVPYIDRARVIPKLVYWRKPAEGWIKLNVDGCCRGNPGSCGGGGVIRDVRGIFKGDFSSSFGHGTNNEVELRALLAGISLCKELGFNQINIENDSTLIVSWLSSRKCTAWYLWDYWVDLLILLIDVHFTINHQLREGNSATDFPARRGEEDNNNTSLDFNSLPRKLKGILRLDKAGLPQFRWYPACYHGFPPPQVRPINKIGRKSLMDK